MTSRLAASAASPSIIPEHLRRVCWLAGGTGSGKTTVAMALARRFDLDIYAGDRAEQAWLTRCTPDRHPHFAAARDQRPGDNLRGRSPGQVFEMMAGLHGETIEFLFGALPSDIAPLLSCPEQAAFLLPSPQFRRAALGRRYADPDRAHANWGDLDPSEVLEARLARDALWDAEVIEQAARLCLPMIAIDGSRSVDQVVDDLAGRFRLDCPR